MEVTSLQILAAAQLSPHAQSPVLGRLSTRDVQLSRTNNIWLIKRHRLWLEWNEIATVWPLSAEFIKEFRHQLHWPALYRNINLPVATLAYLIEEMEWPYILQRRQLPADFLARYGFVFANQV